MLTYNGVRCPVTDHKGGDQKWKTANDEGWSQHHHDMSRGQMGGHEAEEWRTSQVEDPCQSLRQRIGVRQVLRSQFIRQEGRVDPDHDPTEQPGHEGEDGQGDGVLEQGDDHDGGPRPGQTSAVPGPPGWPLVWHGWASDPPHQVTNSKQGDEWCCRGLAQSHARVQVERKVESKVGVANCGRGHWDNTEPEPGVLVNIFAPLTVVVWIVLIIVVFIPDDVIGEEETGGHNVCEESTE